MKRMTILILLAALSLSGCGKETQKTHFAMNTVMNLTLWGNGSEEAAQLCLEEINLLEQTFSVTREDSPLSRINAGETVSLPDAHSSLLEQAEALSRRTGGAFNPKLHDLSQAWGFYDQQYRIPSQQEIDQALSNPRWDLGGALKGYTGDVLCRILAETKVSYAILNLGGNIQTFGEKPRGEPWQIGIQNPDGQGNLGIIQVSGTMAVVTSGDYQKYFEADGKRYHHILDPETGYPADSGLRSVTILCRNGLTADCLSTALFVMGLEEGIRFWRESTDFEAVFLTQEGTIYATEGVSLSGCSYEVIRR